ncbi:peptidoglycan-binding domain-containing protein [uncultured Roseobacter sp.]|uniref:peptidoglycan-binding protein n=1 Tax=uncultured Roseobacter sp. TaxID=114847 RepID=UPI002605ACEF|nr:peptidoglycan-binding domain-containing protein [uncultured Roseobacter sp.]
MFLERQFNYACGAAVFLLLAVSPLSAHADTTQVQQALSDIGCYDGPIDGQATLKLKTAIRCFQKAEGLTPNGKLSSDAEARLMSLAGSGAVVEKEPRYTPEAIRGSDLEALTSPTVNGVPVVEPPKPKPADCVAFLAWQESYRAEHTGTPDYEIQIERFHRLRGEVQPFIGLFKQPNYAVIESLIQSTIPSFQDRLVIIKACLENELGDMPEELTEQRALLDFLRQRNAEANGRQGTHSLMFMSALDAISRAEDEAPALMQELQNADPETIGDIELGRLSHRYESFENALWPLAVQDHKAALIQLRKAVTERKIRAVEEQRQEELRRKEQERLDAELAELKRQKDEYLYCLRNVDPDEPNLPPDLEIALETPGVGSAFASLSRCANAAERRPGDPLIKLAMGRLSLVLSDFEEADVFFEQAVQLGSVSSLAYLGDLEQDVEAALALYERAENQGFEPAREAVLFMKDHIKQLRIIEAEELAVAKQLVEVCDGYAAHPDDNSRPAHVVGVPDDELQFEDALEACIAALDAAPDLARTSFQLGRVLSFIEGFEEDAELQLEAAHAAGYAPAAYYLSELKDKRTEHELLKMSAAAGFPPATKRLSEGVFYPDTPDLSHIFVNPSNLPIVPISEGHLRKTSFSVDSCTNEIFVQVRENKLFETEMNTFVMTMASIVCMLDATKCNVWDRINDTIRNDARAICRREDTEFKKDYPECLQPYWHVQNAEVIPQTPDFALKIMRFYHSLAEDFDERGKTFDATVGDVTDLAAILYFEDIGLDLYSISSADLGDDFMLKESTEPELLALVRDLKREGKYEIAMNMVSPDLVCADDF